MKSKRFLQGIDRFNIALNKTSVSFLTYGNAYYDTDIAFKDFVKYVKNMENNDHNKRTLSGMQRIS